jgi:hypothetical protein
MLAAIRAAWLAALALVVVVLGLWAQTQLPAKAATVAMEEVLLLTVRKLSERVAVAAGPIAVLLARAAQEVAATDTSTVVRRQPQVAQLTLAAVVELVLALEQMLPDPAAAAS